jgi:PAS domain S-box-containing protein
MRAGWVPGDLQNVKWVEAERLEVLNRYMILDTPYEKAFDDIVQLATVLLDTPMAAVSLIDEGRQWFKAQIGLGVRQTPRDTALCAHAILQPDGLVIPDTTLDERFSGNPLVTGAPGLRFYAGEVLTSKEGYPLGTLCVLDTAPRPQGLTDHQAFVLKALARQVVTQLELRRAVLDRDEALSKLKESQNFRKQVVDSATKYAIVSMDIDGKVTSWSAGAENVLGWREDEMLGQDISRIFTPEDLAVERPGAEMHAAMQAGWGDDERWHMRANGERFRASGMMSPLHDENGAVVGFVKILRDRTKEAERSLRLAILAQASAGLLAASEPDDVLGPLLEQNLGLLGFDQSFSYMVDPDGKHLSLTHSTGVPGSHLTQRLHTDLDATLSGIVAKTLKPLILNGMIDSADPVSQLGRKANLNAFAGFPIITSGQLYGVISFGSFKRPAFDAEEIAFFGTLASYLAVVRQRLRAEAELRERDMIWRSSRDLFVTYGPDGQFRSVNPAWEALGYQESELIGQSFARLVHPDDSARVAQHSERLLNSEIDKDFDVRIRAKSGAYHLYSWYCIPEAGEFYAAGRDITERQLLEEQLRQSQKMEAVGQLTGGIAHDFNNLLAGISGSLELMRVRMAEGRTGDLGRYIEAAIRSAERAAALTHRLLAFSRRQTLDSKPTNVARLIESMEDLIQRTVGPAIRLQTVVAPDLCMALCDPNQLENALLNLTINARDAMPEGGLLTLEAINAELDSAYAATQDDLKAGPYIAISVSDNGSGMPAAVRDRVFDPFFTTKPLGEGTGLGLSMVYGFVKQSGGHVRVHSEVGQGTTVRLYLPRHTGALEDGENADLKRSVPHVRPGETVLVVDDEELIRQLVVEVLTDLGYAALEAADAKQAMTFLQSSRRIDMLVTDVGLPGGMNGRQLADAARQLRPNLPVLFITGYAETAVAGSGHLGQGMAVITKPFQMDVLMSMISRVIAGAADESSDRSYLRNGQLKQQN